MYFISTTFLVTYTQKNLSNWQITKK